MNTTGSGRSAAARWALAVVLVLGVLGMHALMVPPSDAGGTVVADSMSESMSTPGAASRAEHAANLGGGQAPMGGHSPAGGHSMLTMCLAVLGALVSVVLLAAALVRRTARVGRSAGAPSVGALSWLGRPPPWTVPSLHQLSLLRV